MLFRLDDRLFHLLYVGVGVGVAGATNGLTLAAFFFSAIGEGWAMLAILPLFALPRARRFAGWLTCTLAGTGVLVFALKALLGRGRPFTVYPALRRALMDSPTDYSLPSGHAAGSFAFALFTTRVLLDAHPRPRFARAVSVGLVLLAACVGVSRVVLGFHFPLDVLAGAILGATIGGLAGRAFTASAGSAREDAGRL